MNIYELMLVLRPDSGIQDEAQATKLIQSTVGVAAKIDSIILHGKKHLAYEIQKLNEGLYIQVKLSGVSLEVGNLEKRVKMDARIIRYLLTRLDNK